MSRNIKYLRHFLAKPFFDNFRVSNDGEMILTPSCLPYQGESTYVYYDLERSRSKFGLWSRSRGNPSLLYCI